MYKLLLQVESKSKAKIIGKSVKHYLVGQDFQVVYRVKNIGDQVFPGGKFAVRIIWPNGQIESTPYAIPQLAPQEINLAEPKSDWGVLARGFALFYLTSAVDNEGKNIILYGSPENAIPPTVSFYSVLGKEPEELYQCWALIVAVAALVILVAEKLFQMLQWALSLLN